MLNKIKMSFNIANRQHKKGGANVRKPLKVIQINIQRGKHLEALIEFLEDERPDIVTLQEITSGQESYGDYRGDIVERLKTTLGMTGAMKQSWYVKGRPDSFLGNGVLARKGLLILGAETVWLELGATEWIPEPFWPRGDEHEKAKLLPRNAIDVSVRCEDCRIHIISAHLCWSKEPIDTPEKLNQAERLSRHLLHLKRGRNPIILGGDFNMTPDSRTVRTISQALDNWMLGDSVHNTINHKLHRAKEDLVVDYICTHKFSKTEEIRIADVDVSDHLPVIGTFALQ